jgi:hypothetical protein
MRAFLLTCVIVVLPLGIFAEDESAENKEEVDNRSAVEKWLGEEVRKIHAAVEKKEITQEQGWERWEALKKEQITTRIRSAVEKELISEEKAAEIWLGIKKGEMGARLRQAVEAKVITEEEAKAKWTAFEKELEVR